MRINALMQTMQRPCVYVLCTWERIQVKFKSYCFYSSWNMMNIYFRAKINNNAPVSYSCCSTRVYIIVPHARMNVAMRDFKMYFLTKYWRRLHLLYIKIIQLIRVYWYTWRHNTVMIICNTFEFNHINNNDGRITRTWSLLLMMQSAHPYWTTSSENGHRRQFIHIYVYTCT